MYRLSRLLLTLAVLEGIFAASVAVIVWWPWPLIVATALIVLRQWERKGPLWAHGTARWATARDLRDAGMVGTSKGLSIGCLDDAKAENWPSTLNSLFQSRVSDQDACNRFLFRVWQSVLPIRNTETVRLSKAVHTAVFGPTGAGKGASFIIPWLLETDESALVLDYKGENATITARHRQQAFGHRIVMLDPFQIVTQQPDSFNPLDFISATDPTAIDDARDLAEQLVVRTGEEREPHWNDSAEFWIAATIIAVVKQAEPHQRSLQTVRDILSNPQKMPQLIKTLCECDPITARLGGQLEQFKDKELSSTLTTTNRHLRFLDTPAIAASTQFSTFDPSELRQGKMTVYCILPVHHQRAQSGLIRMWVGSLMRSVVQGGLQHG